tara:strand:+ start:1223 stop:3382 length:2160 start_codon:yes stop_codon:yes gene_type:complete
MNHYFKLFILFFTLSTLSIAQQATQGEWCATNEMLEKWMEENPEEAEVFKQKQRDLSEMQIPYKKGTQTAKAPTITIPVVVHVIHWNGDGNISKAQIEDGIRVLNEDFQKLNADTNSVRSLFRPIVADSEIEFKLAKRDPNGNCTEGIVRVNSFLTYNAGNNVKPLSGPTLGGWTADKYMNVWLVNSIGSSSTTGTILGYAQFPGSGSLNTYGTVIINREWGTIGTASNSTGRIITHEFGHLFDLLHTFQGGCGNFCTSSGDFICDTPPASTAVFTCSSLTNNCSNDANGGTTQNPNPYTSDVPDMIENHMSYNSCRYAFTEGQKDRMHRALNLYNHLINLKSNANLIATGTNSNYVAPQCSPIADMWLDPQLICEGQSVSFSEASYGGPITTYDWSFPGGTPNSSSSATPTITYNTPGTYDVILRVGNSSGADTLVLQNVVVVSDTNQSISGFGYVQGFEAANSIGGDWISYSPTGGPEWSRAPVGFNSGFSAFLLNNNSASNQQDILMSPAFDLTNVLNPTFQFRVAYRARNINSNDVLRLGVSLDCGATWSNRIFLTPSSMSNGLQLTGQYVPSNTSQWLLFNIPTTAAMRASENLKVRFEFTSGGGNNIFIDDFKIIGQPVGLEDQKLQESNFFIYPNPTSNGRANIQFKPDQKVKQASLFVSNILGAKVQEIYSGALNNADYKFTLNTSNLSPGIYFVTLQSEEGRITKKLVVN